MAFFRRRQSSRRVRRFRKNMLSAMGAVVRPYITIIAFG